ncbi:predicted protein [Nematostella vectensis]|uniref:Uncharacterized protein n=1 Tax=Nematostella vectensis TaxID=45351 RepID=A7RQ14_NEMVE|nr:predicted protein [Nematostella vectensis]|eukprot:XP_001638478.1 predicted protein [Nematostella vectensis]
MLDTSIQEVTSLTEAKCYPQVVYNEKYIYVVWGKVKSVASEEQVNLRSVERYDPVLNTWKHLAPMLVPAIGENCCCLSNDKYYVEFQVNSMTVLHEKVIVIGGYLEPSRAMYNGGKDEQNGLCTKNV